MEVEQIKLAEELLFSGPKKPSFAKKLYYGVIDSKPIFPFPSVSLEEKARTENLLNQLNQFAENHIRPYEIDKNASIPDSVIQGLAKMGILGLTIPKEYGGLGMTQYAFCRVVESLARRCGSTALFVNVHQSIGVKALLHFGTEEQRMRWLPPLAKGDQFSAFSLTEPNAGSDASGIETRAVFDPEKNVYRINGKKQWTTNGSIAQVLTVMAKTSVETPQGIQEKVTAFLVTPEMRGFKITASALEKVGMRGTRTTNLSFENMEVPAANVLGPVGSGLRVALTVLDYGRTTFGALCTGAAKMCVERAIAHAKSRHQFNRPLASFGLVKQKIANISALAYAMDATTYLTAGIIDSGDEDFMLEAAMLKVFTSDSLWQIIYETMQIFGGRSFFTDEPFERMMRDARLNMIGEGANEVMRAFIGVVGMRDVGMEFKEVLEALKKPWNSYSTLSRFFGQVIRRIGASKLPLHCNELKSEADALGKAVRSFGFAVARTLAKYREDVVEQQLVLNRLATSVMAIYTMTAVLSKIDTDLASANGNSNALGEDLAIAKFYCRQALATIDCNLTHLFNPADAIIESLSDQITGVRYKGKS